MKYVLYAVFVALSLVLAYFLMDSVRRPVEFHNTWASRKTEVHKHLEEIVELQKMYKVLEGDSAYADSFDKMEKAFLNDSFFILRVVGDPYDTLKRADTVAMWYPARDSLGAFLAKKGFVNAEEFTALREKADKVKADTSQDLAQNPDVKAYNSFLEDNIKRFIKKMRTVPFSNKKEFVIAAGRIGLDGSRMAQLQSAPTFEVATTVGTYMPEYEPTEYSMYDPEFNPGKIEKVGDLMKVTTAGNW